MCLLFFAFCYWVDLHSTFAYVKLNNVGLMLNYTSKCHVYEEILIKIQQVMGPLTLPDCTRTRERRHTKIRVSEKV